MEDLENIINYLDLIDIYRTLYLINKEYTFFSCQKEDRSYLPRWIIF